MLANYFPYPGTPIAPDSLGAYYSPVAARAVATPAAGLGAVDISAGAWGGWLFKAALKGAAGYYIGGFFGHPIAGAALSATLGLPGLFALAIFSTSPVFAVRNATPMAHFDAAGFPPARPLPKTQSSFLSFGEKDDVGLTLPSGSWQGAQQALEHFWDGVAYGKRSCYRRKRRSSRRRRRWQ